MPGGAFADDMVLTTSTNKNMQSCFNMVVVYFNYFGLEMCIDGREKTVYTHNAPHVYSVKINGQALDILPLQSHTSTLGYG